MGSATGAATEAGPALFAGGVCALFGLMLLVWACTRVRRGEPVIAPDRPAAAPLLAVTGVGFLALGAWWLLSL